MRQLIIITVFSGLIVSAGFAQTQRVADSDTATDRSAGVAPAKSNARSLQSRQDSSGAWEYWNNITLQPGNWINLDSALDYSLSDSVRMTILSQNGTDLRNLVASAFWAVPGLRFFNAADVFTGDGSFYTDARSATFPTYGTQFRLRLTNRGNTPIVLSQLVLFQRAI